jgi:Major Facilitator Superfamily
MILFSYCGATFLSGLAWVVLIPIPDEAMDYYGINEVEMTFYAYVSAFLSIFLTPLSNWIISKSFYKTLHIVWFLNILGCWIRYTSKSNFWISVLGQSIIGSGTMLTLSSCSTLADIWFPKSQALLATSISAASNFIGIGFGFLYMSYSDNISQMMFIQALISSFFFIFNIIVLKKDIKKEESITFWVSVKIAFKDKNLLAMTICAGSGLGLNYTIISLFGILLQNENFSTIFAGWVGFCFLISGLIGGLVATYISEAKSSVYMALKIFLVLSIISSILFAGLLMFDYLTILTSILYGACLTGFLPLGIRSCVEYNPNISESVPTTMIYFSAQVLSCIYTYPILYFSDFAVISGLWLGSFIVFVTFTVYLFYIKISEDHKKYFYITDITPEINDINKRSEKSSIEASNVTLWNQGVA